MEPISVEDASAPQAGRLLQPASGDEDLRRIGPPRLVNGAAALTLRRAYGSADTAQAVVVAKRTLDVALSLVLLVLLGPLMLLAALLVKLDSPGPILFRQRRLGRDMRPLTVVKLRTMVDGASPERHRRYIAELAAGAHDSNGLKKLTGDPRVTRVGRVLRALSIDELPQLFNVLRGEMSLVGPRPALDYELEHYSLAHFGRFRVRPGITGLWQVSGRNRLGFQEMLDLDAEYARRPSVLTDLRILARTPWAAFRHAA